MACENHLLRPKLTDHPTLKVIGKCKYRYCDEHIYEGEGFEYEGFLYCSTGCIGEELLEEGIVVDLAQQ